jgi:hypothetical protein
MPGIAELALGAAPIAGGALLGVAAGNLKPPDIRGMIAKDMDLLERIPDDQAELRARLKDTINRRIDGRRTQSRNPAGRLVVHRKLA